MRVFVTGGNGFIGSVVVRKLVERGHAARCLLRPTSRTERVDALPFERVVGDVDSPASLREGIAGCDEVIHLASLSSWSDIESPRMRRVVVDGTANVLAAGTAAGLPRTVYVSSSVAINGTDRPLIQDEAAALDPRLERLAYVGAKSAAEALCHRAAMEGLPVMIVNPGEVYGPNDTDLITAGNLIDFARSSPVLICRGGTSVVHVDDVAEGILAALERGRPGERYILGGENLTIRQLAALTLQLLGQEKRILLLPNRLIRGLAALGRVLRLRLPFNPAVIPYATRYWFMDNTKARTELDVSFRSARESLAPTLAWLAETSQIPGLAPSAPLEPLRGGR